MSLFNKSASETPVETAKKLAAPDFSEAGVTGLKHGSGIVYEEYIPKLQWPRAGVIYQEMSSNDPVITAILLCSRQLLRNVTWEVTAASTSPIDQEAAQFVRECQDDMSNTWSDFIDDLSSFFEYGFAYHEIVYKRRMGDNKDPTKNSKYTDGRIGWRKIAGRSQLSLHSWEISEDGGLAAFNQYATNGVVRIPIERALLFRTTANRGNPEGRSFLRGAYRPWYFKKHIEEIEGIGIERDLAGLPTMKAPEGVDIFDKENPKAMEAKNNALKLISSIRRDRNEGVLLPYGWELSLLSSGSSRQFDTSAIINRYDQRIAITMLADIVMLGADKVGSFALAKVKQSMLAAALNAQLASVVDILNRYAIPRLFAYNTFQGLVAFPKFKVGSVVAPDLKELGEYVGNLSGSKMPLFPDIDLENFLRRSGGLPETTEDDPLREDRIAATAKTQKTTGGDPNADSNDPEADPEDPKPDTKPGK